MLFVWLNKLVIVPLELVFIGNKVLLFDSKNELIHTEINVILVSFLAFTSGWYSFLVKPLKKKLLPLHYAKEWAIGYLGVALSSLILLYGSLVNYWKGSIFTYVTHEVLEEVGGSALGYLANVGQRFWSFGILLGWSWWQRKYGISQWYWQFPWFALCFLGSLSSNRSNVFYPLLMLASVMFVWRFHYKGWLILIATGVIFLSLFFGYVRVQPTLDTEQVSELFDTYLSNNDYVWYAHQLYFGTPYQITPLLDIDNQTNTIVASLLDPVPILGKVFREESGPYIYNLSVYNSTVSQDKTIPVAGELFFNGGFLLVALCYFIFGVLYRWLDALFKKYATLNPALAASFFYLALLFNAALLLSLSVLVQFLVYNAAPAILIIVLNWVQVRRGS